jgi:hypothetical protein
MIRPRNSVSFAAKWTFRPHVVMIRIGSISEFGWFPANSTGPVRGTFSRPTTSTWRKNTRVTRPSSHVSIRYAIGGA